MRKQGKGFFDGLPALFYENSMFAKIVRNFSTCSSEVYFCGMEKKIINTKSAPAPIGPYSQAVLVNGLLFIAGQVPIDPATGEVSAKNITDETTQVMQNLKAILVEAGMDFSNVVKTTIFLTDMSLFASVNEVYAQSFTDQFPARETVAVKGLPKGVNVEISMIAAQ